MFRIICLGYLFLFAIITGTAAQTASLEIINDPTLRRPFYLSINGVRQNESPVENIQINNLPYEVYGVEIEVANDPKQLKQVVFLRIGQTTSYIFTKHNEQLVLQPSIQEIKAYNKQVLQLVYKNQKSATKESLSEQQSARFADFASPAVDFDDISENEIEVETPASMESLGLDLGNQQQLKFDADSVFKRLKAEIAAQDSEANKPCGGNLSNEELKELKNRIKDVLPLRERGNRALTILGNKCLTVAQLKEILRLLDGDELKVEYYRTVFKQLTDFARRSDLFELFFFESSIDEIQNLR